MFNFIISLKSNKNLVISEISASLWQNIFVHTLSWRKEIRKTFTIIYSSSSASKKKLIHLMYQSKCMMVMLSNLYPYLLISKKGRKICCRKKNKNMKKKDWNMYIDMNMDSRKSNYLFCDVTKILKRSPFTLFSRSFTKGVVEEDKALPLNHTIIKFQNTYWIRRGRLWYDHSYYYFNTLWKW